MVRLFLIFFGVVMVFAGCKPCGFRRAYPVPDGGSPFKLRLLNEKYLDMFDPKTPGHFTKDNIQLYTTDYGIDQSVTYDIKRDTLDSAVYYIQSGRYEFPTEKSVYFTSNSGRKDIIYAKIDLEYIKAAGPCDQDQYKFKKWEVTFNNDTLHTVNNNYFVTLLK